MKLRPSAVLGTTMVLVGLIGIAACRSENAGAEKMTPLEAAIEIDVSPQRVKALLDEGNDPNKQSLNGYTALIRASGTLLVPGEREKLNPDELRNADAIVSLLLEHGANPNLETKDGTTALMLAIASGRTEAASSLVAGGASIESQTLSGDTPLLLSIHHCNLALVRLFVERGANLAHKNLSGETAQQMAKERCQSALQLLPQE